MHGGGSNGRSCLSLAISHVGEEVKVEGQMSSSAKQSKQKKQNHNHKQNKTTKEHTQETR